MNPARAIPRPLRPALWWWFAAAVALPCAGMGGLVHHRRPPSRRRGAARTGRGALTMEYASVSSPAAAFVAGLVTSLHCAGMCGPLACAVLPVRREQGDVPSAATAYHLARLGSYAVLGALAGWLGRMPLAMLPDAVLRWLPWLGVLFFVGLAMRWDRHWPRVPLLGRAFLRASGRLRGCPPPVAAAALGLATPLLPCGPLYFLLGAGAPFRLGDPRGRVHARLRPGHGAAPLDRPDPVRPAAAACHRPCGTTASGWPSR